MRRRYNAFVSFTALVAWLAAAIHVDAAPITRFINHDHPSGPPPAQDFYHYNLDVNNDGTADLSFSHYPEFGTGLSLGRSRNAVSGLNGATVATRGTSGGAALAEAFSYGAVIGPSLQWLGGGLISDELSLSPPPYGNPLFKEENVAIGVQIPIAGQPHYAWVEIQYVPDYRLGGYSRLQIERAAWESSPNTPILVTIPEPTALAMTPALAAFTLRRRPARRS